MTYGHSGYQGKSYQRLLEEALTDESSAGDMYRYMANVSPNVEAAEKLRKIAEDEDRHHLILSHLLAEVTGQGETSVEYVERMETMLGHRGYSQMGGTPRLYGTQSPYSKLSPYYQAGSSGETLFPQTYGDWVDLAERLKTASGNIFAHNAMINYQLQTIAGEGMGETPEAVAQAKRWLVLDAGKYGIK